MHDVSSQFTTSVRMTGLYMEPYLASPPLVFLVKAQKNNCRVEHCVKVKQVGAKAHICTIFECISTVIVLKPMENNSAILQMQVINNYSCFQTACMISTDLMDLTKPAIVSCKLILATCLHLQMVLLVAVLSHAEISSQSSIDF